jgi:hypothetical protein
VRGEPSCCEIDDTGFDQIDVLSLRVVETPVTLVGAHLLHDQPTVFASIVGELTRGLL